MNTCRFAPPPFPYPLACIHAPCIYCLSPFPSGDSIIDTSCIHLLCTFYYICTHTTLEEEAHPHPFAERSYFIELEHPPLSRHAAAAAADNDADHNANNDKMMQLPPQRRLHVPHHRARDALAPRARAARGVRRPARVPPRRRRGRGGSPRGPEDAGGLFP